MRRRTGSIAKWMSLAMLPALLAFAPLATAEGPTQDDGLDQLEYPEVVLLTVDSREALSNLGTMGFDMGEQVFDVEDGVMVEALVTPSQQAALADAGVQVSEAVMDQADFEAMQEEYREMTAAVEAAEAIQTDELRVQRAHWYFDKEQGYFLEVEVWSSAGTAASTTISVEFDTGQSFNLSRFVDAGQYMFHRTNSPVRMQGTTPPTTMTATSSAGGSITVPVVEYLDGTYHTGRGALPDYSSTYQTSFFDKYIDPTEATEMIEELHRRHPSISEIIELPYKSNGYRRKAQALLQGVTPSVSISAPASVAGNYDFAAASYGPSVPAGGTSAAPFVVVNTPTPVDDFPDSPPSEGCGPMVGFPAGAVALVDRGSCPFVMKTEYAQAAGASAVIIVNNVSGAPTSPGGSGDFTIPTVMISQDDGNALKAATGVTGQLMPGSSGVANSNRVGIDSHAWGHEGGNDLSIRAVDPGAANAPLTVTVTGNHIQVSLATDGDGEPTSTAAEVVAAINGDAAASALVLAYTFRGNSGDGVVRPTRTEELSDFLSAPDYVSHEPFTIKGIRIGRQRDGSKTGVFVYSQEHAREWQTPLVAVETASRLLENYKGDLATRRLVNDLDIFIIPSINPDGAHYSMHDFTLQRKTMKNYCEVGESNDLLARNSWGVDLNRNFTVGSLYDGYSGASTSCTSGTFAGPSELSENEAKNEVWLTEQNPHIKFSMNVHSHGGYFMWAPGAYRMPGRVTLPRPSFGTESFFYEASEHILNRITEHRGTHIWDTRVGPIADVLYSAAGNSGDEHFYNSDIFAWSFEVGALRRNANDTGWTGVGGFTPPFAEGYEQVMEFSNGMMGMMEVARIYHRDTINPQAELSPSPGTFSGPQEFTFDLSEPADVYYTLDGSMPTFDSPRIQFKGPRQDQQPILVERSAVIRWFAVDAKGNTTGNWDPETGAGRAKSARITIRP